MFNGFMAQDLDLPTGRIHYRMGGAGDAVLLLHGFPQTHAMWGYIAPLLAQGYRVICPDLRGYGASHKPLDVADYSFREMARDPIALMDHLGIDRFHVVGHDRGGRTAHRMALDIPQRIKSITVMDIVPTHLLLADLTADVARAYYHWFFLAQPAPLPETMIGADPVVYYKSCLMGWGAANEDQFDQAQMRAYEAAWCDPDCIRGMCNDYRAALTHDFELDAGDLHRRLRMPACVMWGRDGIMELAFDVPATWADRFSNITAHGMRGGHFFPDEYPEQTAQTLNSFLKSVSD